MNTTHWNKSLKPLLKKYKDKPHPLEYKNLYQLVVMVILSAQDSDKNINKIAPALFKAFPKMKKLAKASETDLHQYVSKVRNFANKSRWILQLATTLQDEKNIPLTMDELTQLPGIGRKSANVIMRSAGVKAAGIIVDLHVVRVAPRIGITKQTDPKKIEMDLMDVIAPKDWGEVGMAISFLGREICRPTNPLHHECPLMKECFYFKEKSSLD